MNDRTRQPTTEPVPDPKPSAYELAESIAAHMTEPARWTAKRRITPDGEDLRQSADLVRPEDGATISVSPDGYRKEGRVTFRTSWPKYHDGQTYVPRAYPSITCSAERPNKALAREIERRLLVDYDPTYRAALEEVRASDAAAAEAWCMAERIARAVGAEMPRETRYQQQRNGAPVQLYGGPSNIYGLKVHPAYGDTCPWPP